MIIISTAELWAQVTTAFGQAFAVSLVVFLITYSSIALVIGLMKFVGKETN